MITIEMNTARLKLTVKGHAMPEESEQYREICSASSALAQAMVYAATRAEDGTLLKELDYRPDSGDLMVRMIPEDRRESILRQLMDLYGYGMELLARSHPQSVEMIWDGAKVLPDKEMKNK